MSNKPLWLIIIGVMACLLCSCTANRRLPSWIQNKPDANLYYSSVVKVSKYTPEYREKARYDALKDISMQISVMVDGSVTVSETEAWGISASYFNSIVETSTRNQLSDVELAGEYETKNEYWALYRINKENYRLQRRQNAEAAMRLAQDLMLKYDKALSGSRVDFILVITMLFQALDALSDYPDYDFKIVSGDETIHLYSELLHRLWEMSGKITLECQPCASELVARRFHNVKLSVQSLWDHQEGKPIQNLPLTLRFVRGEGDIIPSLYTDAQGKAELTIKRIKSFDSPQTLQLAIDKQAILQLSSHPLVQKMIQAQSFASVNLDLRVRRPRIIVQENTAKLSSSHLNLLKDRLREYGLEVVESLAMADYMVRLEVDSQPGAFNNALNLYSHLCTLHFTLIDTETGEALGSGSVSNIKGSGNTPEMAQQRALQEGIKKLNQETLYLEVYTKIIGF